jgi:hypothetical protein
MKIKVWVLVQEGIWDYEEENTLIEVYNDYGKGLKEFNRLKESAKEDIKNFVSEEDISIDEDSNRENATFSIYENGDYTRTHCNIYYVVKEAIE